MSEELNEIVERRQRAWHQAKALLDDIAKEGRAPTAEENQTLERMYAQIDNDKRLLDTYVDEARMEKEEAVQADAFDAIVKPSVDATRSVDQANALEQYLRTGEVLPGLPVARTDGRTGINIDLRPAVQAAQAVRAGADATELRALLTDTGSSGSLVPTSFVRQLYAYMEASSTIRRIARVWTTSGGEAMEFPTVATHGVGTQVSGQGTVVAGTDPVFGKVTLNAFRYGQLVRLSQDTVQDSGVDIVGFVAENIGRALGRITDTAYVTGGGSTAPNGINTAVTGSVVTGGSLITATFEDLISLRHSVVDEYRNDRAAFVMNDSTAGTLAKLRADGGGTVGAFLWEPSPVPGTPDRLFGFPVYTDTNVSSAGSANRVAYFGDWSTYYIRDAGNMRIERSDERYFDTDEVGFRGIIRTDADLIDTKAIKALIQKVS